MTGPKFSEADVSAALGDSVSYLGSGAFGDTWRVDDTAVKIITFDGYPTDRLDREIEGLRRVASEHVVALRDATTVLLGGKDRPALVFEYIEGGDVAKRISASDWPNSDEVTGLLRGLLVGIGDLHRADTLHRDIKPANIALREGDWSKPVILDLGLARAIDETTITMYPTLIGTTRYMAPEQLAGRCARKAADLFSIGVTVREVIGHEHPFYDAGRSYALDEAERAIIAGPRPLPADTSEFMTQLLDRLTSVAEFDRGSAASSLRRLDAGAEATK